jgi:DnaJ homolog subfamily C member 9
MARKPKSTPEPEDSPPSTTQANTDHGDSTDLEPPVIDPYAVLHLSTDATPDQVKSAYRKLALKHHPDKASPEERETANQKFQEIAFAYAILSDERRRKRYDATGNTAESANIDDDDFDWTDFFREQTQNVVRSEMIEQVKKEYQGTDEERDDILAAYEQSEGDLDAVFESVMCSEVLADEQRFRKIIDEAIASGEVEGYSRYTKESKKAREKRRTHAKNEESEAMELARELGVEEKLFGNKGGTKTKSKSKQDDTDGLQALIQQRQQARAQNFFDDLEARYGGGTNKKRKIVDEPPEEAFRNNTKKGRRGAKG